MGGGRQNLLSPEDVRGGDLNLKISAFPAEPEEVGDKDLEERANDLEGLVDDDEDLAELG